MILLIGKRKRKVFVIVTIELFVKYEVVLYSFVSFIYRHLISHMNNYYFLKNYDFITIRST